jgi:hypothetical protein
MSDLKSSARVDMLLALVLASPAQKGGEAQHSLRRQGSAQRQEPANLTGFSAALPEKERQEFESRSRWYGQLQAAEQEQWLTSTLGRARANSSRALAIVDENLHPSHVIEALRSETHPIQSLVLKNLPPTLAEQVASALSNGQPVKQADEPSGQPGHSPLERGSGRAAGASPDDRIVAVIRRTFLSRFVFAGMLRNPTPLDLFTSVELARFVRLLGVREIAIACRGNSAVESVASFLRRFPAEDAQAISEYFQALEMLEPARLAFAERVVSAAMNQHPAAPALIDHLGIMLLALVMSEREPLMLAYTAQKLPVIIAGELLKLVEEAALYEERDIIRLVIEEAEALAVGFRKAMSVTQAQPRAANSNREFIR